MYHHYISIMPDRNVRHKSAISKDGSDADIHEFWKSFFNIGLAEFHTTLLGNPKAHKD
jgi:hypothetical protein